MRTNIRKLRLENNLTQKQLADKIGMGQSIVTHYETGRRMPTVSTLVKLSKIFNVSIDELINHEHSNYNPEQPKDADEHKTATKT